MVADNFWVSKAQYRDVFSSFIIFCTLVVKQEYSKYTIPNSPNAVLNRLPAFWYLFMVNS